MNLYLNDARDRMEQRLLNKAEQAVKELEDFKQKTKFVLEK